MHAYRTHTCGELRKTHAGQTVKLSGWLHRRREHPNAIFIDLRDHYGITQVVVYPNTDFFEIAKRASSESVLTITGDVLARDAEQVNTELATGDIEVPAKSFVVESAAQKLPLPVFGEPDYPEEVRLTNRFLDLRRETLHKNMVLRSAVIASIRKRMIDSGFTEFQTPILTASSPEGARDYLVPSRIYPGEFYALPQAPQQFKQLLMVSGFDRYFQIAPCFRDEDGRADRSPGEFYQLDLEMSFVTQEDVFNTVEPVVRGVFEEFKNWDGKQRAIQPGGFPHIPYADAMLKYGIDKPDLRNPIICSDVTAFFARPEVEFKAFKGVIEKGGIVRAIPAPGAAGQPRSFFDKMNAWAQKDMQAPGLGYVVFEEEDGKLSGKGPIAKFLPEPVIAEMAEHAGVKAGDALFFAAGDKTNAVKLQGQARIRIGEELDLIEKNIFKFCWIVDFPMYEWDEDNKKVDFSHNPFSMPQGGMETLLAADTIEKQLAIKAFQYDIVCNGVELSSGAIRNHRPDIMLKAFELAGYGADVVEKKFGGMLNAFRYGAPPHGGIAPGIDRIVMLIAETNSIRDVILFPMNQQARDLLMGAPSPVEERQLKELSLRLAPQVKV